MHSKPKKEETISINRLTGINSIYNTAHPNVIYMYAHSYKACFFKKKDRNLYQV